MPNADPAALWCDGLGKSFSGVCVVRGVSFLLGKGRILGLVGENGAGKSTLMNIVGGVLAPDAGRMHLNGKPYAPSNPMEASGRGVAFVHQELNLFPNLSIADNLFITGFPARRILGLPLLDRRETDRRARELLASVELSRAPETLVESLSQGERQLVEIAKALRADASLIIFDEPTTSLTAPETRRLFGMIERLRAAGISIVYISHTLDDVLELSDDILVLRDGEVAGAGPKTGFSEGRLITLMVGRSIEQMFPARSRAGSPDAVLELRGVSQPGIVENVSFTLRRSEILGVSGLMGSGRSELARIIFGLDPAEAGEILLEGEALGGAPPRERIRRGLALLTESRREDGLFLDWPVDENLEIVFPEPGRVPRIAGMLRLACANLDAQPVQQLSGGNQQKVALGKWLVRSPKVFVLDEPTRGIDVGAKHEIYRILNQLAEKGVALLVVSSEIEELMGICDRILVMRKGEVQDCFERGRFDREAILRAAV